MKLELEIYNALCETEKFIINGIRADWYDFGDKEDVAIDEAEEYACGNMKFMGKPATKEILDQYKITIDEYNQIVERLEKGLSFGCCGWCV